MLTTCTELWDCRLTSCCRVHAGGRDVPVGAAAAAAAVVRPFQCACRHCRGSPRCKQHARFQQSHDQHRDLAASVGSPQRSAQLRGAAGVWEDARHAYLHEVLIRRVGCAAALAVIEADILQRLLAQGALDFAVRIDCSDLAALPTPEVARY